MTERTYPRHQWVLHPRTGLPYKAKLLRKAPTWASYDCGDVDSRGFTFRPEKLLRSKKEAVSKARKGLERHEKHLNRSLAAVQKLKSDIDVIEAKDD